MRWYLKLCQIARTHGVQSITSDEPRSYDASDMLMNAEIFVLRSQGLNPSRLDNSYNCDLRALPFNTISVEYTGMNTTALTYLRHPNKDLKLYVLCLVVREFFIEGNPDPEYEFLFLLKINHENRDFEEYRAVYIQTNSYQNEDFINTMKDLLRITIDRIHEGTEGTETTRQVVKFGKGKTKKIKRINRIIHISKRNDIESRQPVQTGKSIDWSHSWLVRGHWRRVKGMGKDRSGNYRIHGRTFVKPHEKGKGDVIHKVRVIE